MSAYRELEARFSRIADLRGALSVLHWDRAAMMPPGGNEARAEQVATLRGIAHELLTSARTGELLSAAENERAGLDRWQGANLREMRRSFTRATAIPPELVGALARATARAEMIWRSARPASDFAALASALEEVVRLTREEAQALGEALDLPPYDALLDGYEAGMRSAEVERLFAELALALPAILEQALARQVLPLPLSGSFPTPAQRALGVKLMTALGFDFDHGRLDESAHPFCGGTPDDVRLTTRYDESDPTFALMAILHETGHALYNAGLPAAWRRQPVGSPCSFAVHESQSLLVEMRICRSQAFQHWLAPQLAEAFGTHDALAPENLYRRAIRVERGFIRVDADEITYPLHVILRFRLERALIEGDLEVADLPAAWNDGMGELLGITPPDDRRGVLQDIHWPAGAFGYFPCYTLGALLAAQLHEAALEAEPEIEAGIARGEFAPLIGWLRTTIHEMGSLLETPELIMRATGRPLELGPFLGHLEARYLA
jgi:carboxypeptidase Taq